MANGDMESPSPEGTIGFDSRWGHSQVEGGNSSGYSKPEAAARPRFHLTLELNEGDERLLTALTDAIGGEMDRLRARVRELEAYERAHRALRRRFGLADPERMVCCGDVDTCVDETLAEEQARR